MALGGLDCPRTLQPHPLELPVQRLPLDPQNLRRAALIAVGRGQHAADLIGFRIGQRFAGAVARIHLLDGLRARLRRRCGRPGARIVSRSIMCWSWRMLPGQLYSAIAFRPESVRRVSSL